MPEVAIRRVDPTRKPLLSVATIAARILSITCGDYEEAMHTTIII